MIGQDKINEDLKLLNDYSCLEQPSADRIIEFSHYTQSIDAVRGIINGTFWATNIEDFWKENDGGNSSEEDADVDEGLLILEQLYKLIVNSFVDKRIVHKFEAILKSRETREAFYKRHSTYVVSLCCDTDSQYMWDQYAKGGYNIVFDRRKLEESLRLPLKNSENRKPPVFKIRKVVYSNIKQKEIITSECEKLLKNYGPYGTIDEEAIINHLMYIGNFFKRESKYQEEKECRLLVNTIKNDGNIDILPMQSKGRANKRHVDFTFDKGAILRVICDTQEALNALKSNIDENINIVLRR